MALASLADRIPVPAAEAAKDRSAPGKVSGRLKACMDALIWEGLSRAEAAKRGNMSEHSLYAALRKPHVRAHYLNELDVLRTSERARSIHRLTELREQDDNKMVAFNAAKELAGSDDANSAANGRNSLPGLQIVIQTGSAPVEVHSRVIDAQLTHEADK